MKSPESGAEKPYATLILRFFRNKGFEVDGESIEMLAPGHVYRVMPGIFREMRRIRGKAVFDKARIEEGARQAALKKSEVEDIPVVKREREIV